MASVTQNPEVLVQTIFHAFPLSFFTANDKDTVGVNIRKGMTPICPNFDPLCIFFFCIT